MNDLADHPHFGHYYTRPFVKSSRRDLYSEEELSLMEERTEPDFRASAVAARP